MHIKFRVQLIMFQFNSIFETFFHFLMKNKMFVKVAILLTVLIIVQSVPLKGKHYNDIRIN